MFSIYPQVKQLSDELRSVSEQKDCLSEDAKNKVAELEKIQASIISLTEERDQALAVLQGLRDEKNQLKNDLEEKDDLVRAMAPILQNLSVM